MKQVTECFAKLEIENKEEFFIHYANEYGVVIFMRGWGNRLIAYSDVKRITVRERIM